MKKILTISLVFSLGCGGASPFGNLKLELKDAGFLIGALIEIYIPQAVSESIKKADDKFRAYKAWEVASLSIRNQFISMLSSKQPKAGDITAWFELILGKSELPLPKEDIDALAKMVDILLSLIPVDSIEKAFENNETSKDIRVILLSAFSLLANKIDEALTWVKNIVEPSLKTPKISTASNQKLYLKDGDIIVLHSRTGFLSEAISTFSGYPYDHVVMYMNNYFYEYSNGGCQKFQSDVIPRDSIVLRYFNELSENQKESILAWWNERIDKHSRYGLELLINLVLVKIGREISYWSDLMDAKQYEPWIKRTAYGAQLQVCSTSIDESYRAAGIDLLIGTESWTTPGDFLKSQLLNRIDPTKMIEKEKETEEPLLLNKVDVRKLPVDQE